MNEKKNLQDIASLLSEQSGISQREAEIFIKEWQNTLVEALWDKQFVKIKNLGNFKLSVVSDRESIDVTTGERMLIPAHYKISFIPDNGLAQRVNEPFLLFETVELNPEGPNPVEEADEMLALEIEQPIAEQPVVLKQPVVEPVDSVDSNMDQLNDKNAFSPRQTGKSCKTGLYICIIVLSLIVVLCAYFYFEDATARRNANAIDYRIAYYGELQKMRAERDSSMQDDLEQKPLPPIHVPTDAIKQRILRSGERLTLIAWQEYGDKIFWVYLYEENKAIINNPDIVPVGLNIQIPPASKYGIDPDNKESVYKARELQRKIQQNKEAFNYF